MKKMGCKCNNYLKYVTFASFITQELEIRCFPSYMDMMLLFSNPYPQISSYCVSKIIENNLFCNISSVLSPK